MQKDTTGWHAQQPVWSDSTTTEGAGWLGWFWADVFWAVDCRLFSFSPLGKEVQLLASASAPVLQAVRQCPSHLLENGHHLGWGQPPVHLPAEHAGSPGDDWLALGLLHQPQCCWLPHQVRPSTAPRQLGPGSTFPFPLYITPVGTQESKAVCFPSRDTPCLMRCTVFSPWDHPTLCSESRGQMWKSIVFLMKKARNSPVDNSRRR